tara:strand:+ start:2840 stop:3418 length:579 start_codon:yes stop_codon:yes gene_type:complete
MEVKLTIPDNWNDVSIGVYQNYVKIQESKKAEKTKIVESLALLCNTSTSVVKKMAYNDLKDIMNIIKTMIDTEPKKTDFKKLFEFKGELYGFCPNLNALSTGEYIDLESYCKKPIENLHTIMSILYRKVTKQVGKRYSIEPYNPEEFKEELFKDCPMSIALSSLGFFLTLGERLERITRQYLQRQNMTQQRA